MTNRESNQQKHSSPIKNFFMPLSIGRREFIGRNLGFLILASIVLSLVAEDLLNISTAAYIALSIALYLLLFPFSIIPRMRDIKFNPFFSFMMLIPGVNIVMGLMLLFSPGKKDSNQGMEPTSANAQSVVPEG